MSDDLFKCRRCAEIKDKDEKIQLSVSNYSTKASAKAPLCSACWVNVVNTIGFKFGEWKEWPKFKGGKD